MAGYCSASLSFYTAILSVFTVSLCLSLVSARLFPSMEVDRTWAGSVMMDPHSASQWQSGYRREIRSAHEVEANVNHEFEYHQGPFKFKYVMLPKGPVPPSGPSPCHNDSPDSALLHSDYFPCSESTLP